MEPALVKFYLACFLSSFGDRIWFFALSIYFITFNNDSLTMTAINALSCNIAAILLGPAIGVNVDKRQRIRVVRVTLFLQNVTLIISCGLVVAIIVLKDRYESIWDGNFTYFLQGILIFFNVISHIASLSCSIAVEKDWAIVIVRSLTRKDLNTSTKGEEYIDDKAEEEQFKINLVTTNTMIKRIELIGSGLAPVIVGSIMSFVKIGPLGGITISAIIFAVWNVISFAIEVLLLGQVYSSVPELERTQVDMKISAKLKKFDPLRPCKNMYHGCSAYLKQGLLIMPSIAFAILYLNVLNFDSVTIGYSKTQGLKESFISIMQLMSVVTGIIGMATFSSLYQKLKKPLALVCLIGVVATFVFLLICFVAIWLPGSPFYPMSYTMDICQYTNQTVNETTVIVADRELSSFDKFFFLTPCRDYTSILVLLSGIVASRFGVMLAEVSVMQMIQENVSDEKRGKVGGVQSSLNRFFDTIKYVCVLIFPSVTQYGFLVVISLGAALLSLIIYVIFFVILVVKKKYTQVPVREYDEAEETDSKPGIRKSQIQIYRGDDGAKVGDDGDESDFNEDEDHAYVNVDRNRPGDDSEFYDDERLNPFKTTRV